MAAASNDQATAYTIFARPTSVHKVFEIHGYSLMSKSLPNRKGITSCSFNVGDCTSWHIQFCPNGDSLETAGFVSLRAALDRTDFTINATIGFDLLDLDTGEPVPRYSRTSGLLEFTRADLYWGFGDFIKREELEKDFLKDDCFSVTCNITVIEFLGTDPTPPRSVLPPPDLAHNFWDLLRSERGADVRFRVGGETFSAHRCVLAARSPVFRAELYGAMKESSEQCVQIDGMVAEVFRNLLLFAYTDELPPEEETEEDDVAMSQHLMEAADRYGMERLKLLCADRLCRKIDVGTAATTLALAVQHRCHGLKDACFKFLFKTTTTLGAVMATDGFSHLATACPDVLEELQAPAKEDTPAWTTTTLASERRSARIKRQSTRYPEDVWAGPSTKPKRSRPSKK